MCTVNRLFKHIIPNDGNDGNVTCWIFAVITIFYLSPHSPQTFEVVLTRFGSLISPYVLLAINQALPYGCSFVTSGHPEGSAAI